MNTSRQKIVFFCVCLSYNLELLHDLPRSTKSNNLGLQEMQQNLVKSAQPMIQLFRAVARALIGGCIFIYSCYARLILFEISCH